MGLVFRGEVRSFGVVLVNAPKMYGKDIHPAMELLICRGTSFSASRFRLWPFTLSRGSPSSFYNFLTFALHLPHRRRKPRGDFCLPAGVRSEYGFIISTLGERETVIENKGMGLFQQPYLPREDANGSTEVPRDL